MHVKRAEGRADLARMPTRPTRLLLTSAVLCAGLAAPASAADPVMRLTDVRSGMQCTGYSVVRGVDPVPFAVEILDVIAGDAALDSPRLLVGVSGPAVDLTGLGPGFSGSPVYCPDAQGTPRVAGAISESVGEYGGKVGLATPIEAVLGVPVEAPAGARRRTPASRPLAAPMTISGLNPALGRAVQRVAQRAGHQLFAAPAQAPAGFPARPLRPGSSMAAGLASGDLTLSAIGTVTYVDGNRVWGFGHPLDGAGPRALFLQDAYVYRVINNPVQAGSLLSTYKLAAPGRTVGTLTYDGLSAVAGRTGAAPPSSRVAVRIADRDTDRRRAVDVLAADETDLGNPGGFSPVSLVAPLAVAEGVTTTLGASPPRLSGDSCVRISLRERRKPIGFCNRYVIDATSGGFLGIGNGVAEAAAADVAEALALVESFKAAELHVEGVSARVGVRRGALLAELRGAGMPRRVRPGQKVRVTLRIEGPDGSAQRRSFGMRIPADLRRGVQRLRFIGSGPDQGGGGGDLIGLSTRPTRRPTASLAARRAPGRDDAALERLAAKVSKLRREDGVSLQIAGAKPIPVFRDPELRIAGRASVRVEVRGPRKRRG